MSAFDLVAVPGKMPTSGGGSGITPDSLFRGAKERAEYQRILDAVGAPTKISDIKDFKGCKVKVDIFDLSDADQRKAYEKLWAKLLVKASNMEAVVESSKDLVHRKDGTSYWMKYVEYVEFAGDGDGSKHKSARERN